MTRFGFVPDQRSRIGCPACTVACRQEHGARPGVLRTWVKYSHTDRRDQPDTKPAVEALLPRPRHPAFAEHHVAN